MKWQKSRRIAIKEQICCIIKLISSFSSKNSLIFSRSFMSLKILKSLGSETNFFVISHKGEVLQDKFEKQIRFEKINGFSKSFSYE